MKTAIVTGMIASYPVGGVLWDYGQYALGLEQLGYDVFYLEDTGWQTYNPDTGLYGDDGSYGSEFLGKSLGVLSETLAQRWHFRNMDGTTYGIDPDEFRRVLARADLFLNVSGGTLLRDEYMDCRCKILIDSDPGWNHFRNYPKWDAQPGWQGSHGYRAHDHFFTYAERMGQPDCPLPDMGISWHRTRPPVVLDCWRPEGSASHWTTIMTWKNFNEEIVYQGTRYGTKEMEFDRVAHVPSVMKDVRFEIALGGAAAPVEKWKSMGWSVCDAKTISGTAEAYRNYIQSSRGEFSVAKNVYVATRSGWFSCRSVCYLAAGRPVIVQDTGFSEYIPTGHGLFAFNDSHDACRAVEEIERQYAHHCNGAMEMARRYFDARVVLGEMLDTVGLT